MIWERLHAGWYEAVDADGYLWRIVQVSSHGWQVVTAGREDGPTWDSLRDAKSHAESGGMAGHYRRKSERRERAARS